MQQASVTPQPRMTRLFVAVELPNDVKQELLRLEKIFQDSSLLIGNYPQSDAMHMTLKFIGNVPEEKITGIRQLLRGVVAKSMKAQLKLLKAFGNPRWPKVLYVDVDCPQLYSLVLRFDEVLTDFCAPEEREFKSHVTIARVKQTLDSDGLLKLLHATYVSPIVFSIDHFSLMKSELTSDGPIHTIVERYELNV